MRQPNPRPQGDILELILARLDGIDKRLDSIEAKVDKNTKSINNLESKVDSLDQSIKSLCQICGNVLDDVQEIQETLKINGE